MILLLVAAGVNRVTSSPIVATDIDTVSIAPDEFESVEGTKEVDCIEV